MGEAYNLKMIKEREQGLKQGLSKLRFTEDEILFDGWSSSNYTSALFAIDGITYYCSASFKVPYYEPEKPKGMFSSKKKHQKAQQAARLETANRGRALKSKMLPIFEDWVKNITSRDLGRHQTQNVKIAE